MRLPIITLCALAAGANATAQSLTISNPSFEAPTIGPGTFATSSAPPGWSAFGNINFNARTIGVLNPSTTTLYSVPAPHGSNVGVVFLLDDFGNQSVFTNQPAGLEQTLADTLATATRYTLRVAVGNIATDPTPPHNSFQFGGFPGYRVELRAGGTVIGADANTLLPAEGVFVTSTVVVDIGTTHTLAGQPLSIRLVNLNAAVGIEVNFDDIRLDAESLATGAEFCFGDASGTACPCGNVSPAGSGEGCLNSLGIGGRLTASGAASVGSDSVTLCGAQMPNSAVLYFQGTTQVNGGLGAVFGDGLRCVGGGVVRLATQTNFGGASQYPELGDTPISGLGALSAGDVRTYQCWYRNAAAFCTASTFNLTNGLSVTWGA